MKKARFVHQKAGARDRQIGGYEYVEQGMGIMHVQQGAMGRGSVGMGYL